MSVQTQIESSLSEALALEHMEVVNESGQHNVPPGSESHFKLVLVSEAFAGKSLVARHRQIYGLLGALVAGPVHALALHTYTPAEWRERHGDAPLSPPCRGGGKHGAEGA